MIIAGASDDPWSGFAKPALKPPQAKSVKSPPLDVIIQRAARAHGIDPAILRAVGDQETGLGKSSVYDPVTGRSRTPGNAGHGIWQLDPASGASQTDLDRAARDPAFAADRAASMLSRSMKANGGSVEAALASYNAGSPQNPIGQAYARQVMQRLPSSFSTPHGGLQVAVDRVSPGRPKGGLQLLSDTVDPFRAGAKKKPSPNDPWADAVRREQRIVHDPTFEALQAGMTPPGPSNPIADAVDSKIHSFISQVAGHQDIMFILLNAQDRDSASGHNGSGWQLMHTPGTFTSKAWELYKKDPVAAMDEYGFGSTKQEAFIAAHGQGIDKALNAFLAHHPKTNALATMFGEFFNPVSWGEGLGVGKLLGNAGKLVKGSRAEEIAQQTASQFGMGSPFYALDRRGGQDATQWANSLIARTNHADSASYKLVTKIMGGLKPDEQWEVVRLSQGLKPNPNMLMQHGDLAKRAAELRADISHVTNEQLRTGILKPKQVYNRNAYFPMSNSYDFGPQYELETRLRGNSMRGGIARTDRPKVFDNYDQASASGMLDPQASAAENMYNWRRQRLQHVAFNDAMDDAPASLRLAGKGNTKAFQSGQGTIAGMTYVEGKKLASMARLSPVVRKSLLAPELVEWLGENGQFKKYIDRAGSAMPGNEQSWIGKFTATIRNAIITNPAFHPAVNVAGNDAAARSLHGLGGPIFEIGGYGYNAAKAVALQLGIRQPEHFVGGAQEYAAWMDRALKSGATAEFGAGSTSALSTKVGSRIRTATESGGGWSQRLDRIVTKATDWNRERTFGDKGEAAFAVSLFKDAVERGGMSDYQAASMVRRALGDYYNMDPKSKWGAFYLFMPWLKSNSKFWTTMLTQRPQTLAAPTHAIRNYNIGQGDPGYEGPHEPGDFSIYSGLGPGGQPTHRTIPFVGRMVTEIGDGIAQMLEGHLSEGAYKLANFQYGRANPLNQAAQDALYTIWKGSDPKNVIGPETDYHAIFNAKAPFPAQLQQVGLYFVGKGTPLPLFRYALEDAVRRGFNPHDLTTALLTAGGAGYSSSTMSDDQRLAVKQAKKQFLSVFNSYQYDSHDPSDLNSAWSDYVTALQDAGILHSWNKK